MLLSSYQTNVPLLQKYVTGKLLSTSLASFVMYLPLSDQGSETSRSEESENKDKIDIDLNDPDMTKAATKIQASFKGHQVRKEMRDQQVRTAPTVCHHVCSFDLCYTTLLCSSRSTTNSVFSFPFETSI